MGKRFHALGEKVAKEGLILTEQRLKALEKKKVEHEANGEIETFFLGIWERNIRIIVGNVIRVGKIYQQTFIDTYSKLATCKLYD